MTIQLTDNSIHNVNWIRKTPIAHRCLHNAAEKRYENTLSAAKAAMDNGFPMEVDLQPSKDMVPMVFHDFDLKRMTNHEGKIREINRAELQKIRIMDSDDTIPSLSELLELVGGKVGIILELKGLPGYDDGFVEAVKSDLKDYSGNVAIMSFHHHILKDARAVAPQLSLGLTAEGGDEFYDQHREITEIANPDFISYEIDNLDTKFVGEFTETGKPSISWTVRSPKEAQHSAKFVDQITFENFRP